MGSDLSLRARGIDASPIITEHEVKSISQENTFERDVRSEETLRRTLRLLSENVGYRLRQSNLDAGTVRLKLRWPDFTTLTRQVTLPQPTDQDGVIYAEANHLFHQVWENGKAVRLLGVGVSGLRPSIRQLSLWDTSNERERRLLEAMDDLRERYGHQVLFHGNELKGEDQRDT